MLGPAWAAEGGDADRLALLADTHIDADPARVIRGVNMTDHLRAAAADLAGLRQRQGHVLINGDCACLEGLAGDYAQLGRLLEPLRRAGYPVHLTMGNHDDRDVFRRAMTGAGAEAGPSPVEGKLVSVVATPRVDWFLLDSLDQVNKTPGRLGQAQLDWLARALDERAEKPAVVVAHHNPQFELPAGKKDFGVLDTAPFFDLLRSRRRVKAYVFGHSHDWSVALRDGIHLINLPPVAYVFAAGKPSGWVEATAQDGGMTLTLHALDKTHPQHGESHDLKWRA
jgi:3',5'-cyclic AMP phosphodiesterase CpdA